MGLLSKLKSALGLGQPAKPSGTGRGQDKPAAGRNRKPRTGEQGQQQPRRSRTARPGDRPEGAEKGSTERRERGERSERPDRPRRERSEREGKPRRDRRDRGDRPRRERGERPRGDREARNTPAGASRPGGAFTAEQREAFAQAHAAWDPASYQVAEAEGKKRFVDFGLPSEILHAVADLGFEYCTPIQAQSLEFSLAGKNVAGRAQTGTGKTAAFLIAVLTRYLNTPEKRNLQPGTPRALILAPTRELVIQICKDAEALGKYCGNVRSLAVYGGMDYDRQRRELEEAPVDLLVATPGRLKDYMRSRIVDLRQVDTLVIDEADRMLDMGFIPDVRAIVNRLPDRDHRCTMLYSATLNETVMNLAAMWMRDPVRVEIESESLATDTVRQIVYIARSEEKFKLLYNHLVHNPEARTIIFCNRKFSTERIAENLRRRSIPCEVLSGDVNQVKRLKILEAFRAGSVRTVVATDVAGRGIHVDDIAFVINYDFPYEPEDYVHRIGRTGRAGHTGTAISFADEDESFIIPDIEKYINEPLKCTMPEEWMYAELPQPAARQRRERSERKPRPESAPEAAPAPEAEAVSAPESPAPEAPAPVEASAPEVEVASVPEAPAPEVAPEAPAAEAVPAPAPVAEEAKPEGAEAPTEGESAKAETELRPEREPRFKPRSRHDRERRKRQRDREAAAKRAAGIVEEKPAARPERPSRVDQPRNDRPPRRPKPVAQHWARTQADGPRDGSESHHAAPTIARPIYAPGKRGPVTAEWTPGQ
ncbi:MAG: DEAD/DEAH box helicase [Candidatus Spyradenecus sp.]